MRPADRDQPSQQIQAQRDEADLVAVRVLKRYSERILQRTDSVREIDAVFPTVCGSLGGIPLELHPEHCMHSRAPRQVRV